MVLGVNVNPLSDLITATVVHSGPMVVTHFRAFLQTFFPPSHPVGYYGCY